MGQLEANLEVFLAIGQLGVALVLSAIAFLSYQRLRNRRALLIAMGLFVFALQGVYVTWSAFESRGTQPWVSIVAALDLVVLGFLYLSMRTR